MWVHRHARDGVAGAREWVRVRAEGYEHCRQSIDGGGGGLAGVGASCDHNLAGIETDVAWIEGTTPAKAICDYAESHGINLIVVGSHGRGGVERWLLGSVAERVVRHATCNVYVVRR